MNWHVKTGDIVEVGDAVGDFVALGQGNWVDAFSINSPRAGVIRCLPELKEGDAIDYTAADAACAVIGPEAAPWFLQSWTGPILAINLVMFGSLLMYSGFVLRRRTYQPVGMWHSNGHEYVPGALDPADRSLWCDWMRK